MAELSPYGSAAPSEELLPPRGNSSTTVPRMNHPAPPPAAISPALAYAPVAAPRADNWLGTIARWLLVLAVFFSGHGVLKLGGVNLTVADVALLGAGVIYLGQRRVNLAPFGSMTPIWLFGLTAMLGGLFVSTIAHGDPIRWINIAAQYTTAFMVLPLILMAVDTQFARRLVLAYIFGVVVSQIVGILAFFYLSPAQTGWISPGFLAGNGRVGAMAGEPNPNGATIAFALGMLVYAGRKGLLKPLLAFALSAVLAWGLLLSASVTGIAASFLAVTTVLAFTGMGRLVKVALVVVVAAGLYINSGAPLPQTFEKRVGVALSTGDVSKAGTFESRSDLIREAWERAEDNLFIGLGADRFREVSPSGQPVHNLHLLIWNEGGALAYVGLLVMLSLLVIFALAALRERREEAAMALAVVGVLWIYTMSIPHMYSRFWILPAILALSTIYARPTPMLVPLRPVPA